jgi:hypothetical protein
MDNSNAKLIFLWVYYCKAYPLTVIEPFSMVRLFRASSYSKYIPTTVGFLSFNACSCLVHVTLYHVRRGGLLPWFLGSSCHQLPSFRFFWTVSPIAVTEYIFSSTTVKQIPLWATLFYFKFSCNWRVYCNVNIAFVVLISWMVPRVSMIPVNISYFILLNLHFKISNKYELMMKKKHSWNFNRI